MPHRAAVVVVVVAVWLKLFGFKRIYSRAHGPARCSCWFERVRFNCTYARAHGPARWCCCCVYFWLKPFRFTCIYARAHGPARCCSTLDDGPLAIVASFIFKSLQVFTRPTTCVLIFRTNNSLNKIREQECLRQKREVIIVVVVAIAGVTLSSSLSGSSV